MRFYWGKTARGHSKPVAMCTPRTEASEETNPLVPCLWQLPEMWKNKFLSLKPPSLCYFVMAAQKMNAYFKLPNVLSSYFCEISFNRLSIRIHRSWLQMLWQFSHQWDQCAPLPSPGGRYDCSDQQNIAREILWQFLSPGLKWFWAPSSCLWEYLLLEP